MSDCGTSQEEADAGLGCYGCYWEFEDNSFTGTAKIESDYDSDVWSWRVTKHEI